MDLAEPAWRDLSNVAPRNCRWAVRPRSVGGLGKAASLLSPVDRNACRSQALTAEAGKGGKEKEQKMRSHRLAIILGGLAIGTALSALPAMAQGYMAQGYYPGGYGFDGYVTADQNGVRTGQIGPREPKTSWRGTGWNGPGYGAGYYNSAGPGYGYGWGGGYQDRAYGDSYSYGGQIQRPGYMR